MTLIVRVMTSAKVLCKIFVIRELDFTFDFHMLQNVYCFENRPEFWVVLQCITFFLCGVIYIKKSENCNSVYSEFVSF